MARETRTLADGQLTTSAAAIITGAQAGESGYVSATLSNVGVADATVTLTFSRAGGTQRRLAYAVLAPNESLRVVDLPIQGGDTLYGKAAGGEVDYLVTVGSPGGGNTTVGLTGAAGGARAEMSGELELSAAVELADAPDLLAVLLEQAGLLRRIVLALESMVGSHVPDPLGAL